MTYDHLKSKSNIKAKLR